MLDGSRARPTPWAWLTRPSRGRHEEPFTRGVYVDELRALRGLTVVATLFLLLGWLGWLAATDLDRNGVRTTGEVTQLYDSRRGPTQAWVSYHDRRTDGRYVHHQYIAIHGSLYVGDRVPVAHRPDRPAEARVTAWFPFWPGFVLSMGAVGAVLASLMAAWAWHEHRRQARDRIARGLRQPPHGAAP